MDSQDGTRKQDARLSADAAAPKSADCARAGGVSVVIAWVNRFEWLVPGLQSLATQHGDDPLEIIVVTRHEREPRDKLQRQFPCVTLISAPRDTSIPMLRAIGMRAARGEFVAVTEDHCIPSPDWIATIEARLRAGCDVAGGPVENAYTDRVRDWAAFLTEYAGAILPMPSGPARSVPGNNAAYRRKLVDPLCDTLTRGSWESFHLEGPEGDHLAISMDANMLIRHGRPFDFAYFVSQRFHFCRSFAQMRRERMSRAVRCVYGFGCVLLPPMLWWRALRALLAKRRLVGKYLLCTPLISIYLTAGAFGEMIGYFFGGGTSLERVE